VAASVACGVLQPFWVVQAADEDCAGSYRLWCPCQCSCWWPWEHEVPRPWMRSFWGMATSWECVVRHCGRLLPSVAQVRVAHPLQEGWEDVVEGVVEDCVVEHRLCPRLECWNATACSRVAYPPCSRKAFSVRLVPLVGGCHPAPGGFHAAVADSGASEGVATSLNVAHSSWHWVVVTVARVARAAAVVVVNHACHHIGTVEVLSGVCPGPSVLQYCGEALRARPQSTACVEETTEMVWVFRWTSQASCPSWTSCA